jgi:hypothetical protein
MTHQPDLFHRCLGRTEAHQGELFPLAGAIEHETERCQECSAYLVETTSGYWCCPRGHGRLQVREESAS